MASSSFSFVLGCFSPTQTRTLRGHHRISTNTKKYLRTVERENGVSAAECLGNERSHTADKAVSVSGYPGSPSVQARREFRNSHSGLFVPLAGGARRFEN